MALSAQAGYIVKYFGNADAPLPRDGAWTTKTQFNNETIH